MPSFCATSQIWKVSAFLPPEEPLPLLPPQITHLGATVSPDNSYSLRNAQAGGFVIRCRREMYGGYDRYLLEKQL